MENGHLSLHCVYVTGVGDSICSSANDFSNLPVWSAPLLSQPHPLSRHGPSPPVCLLTAFPGHSDYPSTITTRLPPCSRCLGNAVCFCTSGSLEDPKEGLERI